MRHYVVYALLALLCTTAWCGEKPTLKGVTVLDNYPYSYVEHGVLQGLGIDVVKVLAERAGYQIVIETQPPTRALKTAENEPFVMVFSLFRTPEREPLYYWIGPISTTELWLYKLKSRTDIHVHTLDDAKHYVVGTTASDATIPLLKQLGIQFDTAPSDLSNCRKFKFGRFDLVPVDPNGVKELMAACDIGVEQIEKLVKLPTNTGIYIGIGKHTPKDVVNRLNQEMDGMKKDQTIQRINAKWNIN